MYYIDNKILYLLYIFKTRSIFFICSYTYWHQQDCLGSAGLMLAPIKMHLLKKGD